MLTSYYSFDVESSAFQSLEALVFSTRTPLVFKLVWIFRPDNCGQTRIRVHSELAHSLLRQGVWKWSNQDTCTLFALRWQSTSSTFLTADGLAHIDAGSSLSLTSSCH
jgi:hypothetical protein